MSDAPPPHPGSEGEPGGPVAALLRVPLYYKILIANAVIVVVGAVLGTWVTRHLLTPSAGDVATTGVVLLFAAGGVAITLLVNALILRLALNPLKLLEQTAARVQAGDVDARVPRSMVADREMERLRVTFNAMLDALEASQQRVRDVAARAQNASEEERKRIARELHDDTAQTLAALMIRLRILRTADDPEVRLPVLEQFRGEIAEALERIRRFARGLRPPALDELGLVPALESHVRNLSESVGAMIRIEAQPVDGMLTPQAELALYRITQEAISNAVRHAGAERIELQIAPRGQGVEVSVRDDGIGFSFDEVVERNGGGLGIFGMQERAVYIGGRVEIDSAPGRGTVVRAYVPATNAPAPALLERRP